MKNRNSKEEIQNDIDFLIEMEEQADRATNFTGKYSGQSDTGSSHHLMTLIANWKGELLALSKGDQTKNNTMKENETKPFPKYMYSKITKLVVLMTEPKVGIVTTSDGVCEFGYQYGNWNMDAFTDIEFPEVAHPEEKPMPVGVWKCIKDLTMQVGWIAFKKGRLYEQLGWANRSVLLSNEKGEPHEINEDCTEYFYQVK